MKRVAILCPGRGSYTEKSLGSLADAAAGHPWLARAEELRAEYELAPLAELDGAERFRAGLHLLPANASPLIYLISMIDAAEAARSQRVVAVGGNSLGWYTALAVAGALSFDDGFRLVQEMSLLQQELAQDGGQVLYPIVDEDWRRDPALIERVERALADSNGAAFASIDLGGYRVLAGTEAGVAHLLQALTPIRRGATPYPFRLVQHGPYHTPLATPVAERARAQLARLDFRAPSVALVDGRGARFSPWSCDTRALLDYTLGAQIDTPYDFTACVRVMLREYAPDLLVLPGPGNTLGGVCAQILIDERMRGLGRKADFEALQASAEPAVLSMRR